MPAAKLAMPHFNIQHNMDGVIVYDFLSTFYYVLCQCCMLALYVETLGKPVRWRSGQWLERLLIRREDGKDSSDLL